MSRARKKKILLCFKMKSVRVHLAGFLILAYCGLIVTQQLSIFVDTTTGSDLTGDGTINKPFQTIVTAQMYIRYNVTKESYSQINVELRKGLYLLTAPIVMTAEDSGTESMVIRYRAYNGEDVRVIGGRIVGGWSLVTDSAVLKRLNTTAKSHVLVADLGSTDLGQLMRRGFGSNGAGFAAMELYFKTDPMTLARYPNSGFLTVSQFDSTTSNFTFDSKSDKISNWKLESDPWAFGYWYEDWADDYIPIDSFVSLGSTNVSAHIGSMPGYGVRAEQRFFLQNFLSELDSPGEYYIDRNSSKIYFWPPTNDYTDNDFVVSVAPNVFSLTNVAFVTFEGFTIEASRKEGVKGTSLTNVTVSHMVVRNTGTDALNLRGSNIIVEYCQISNAGDRGIWFVGGDRNTLTRANNVARNNIITKFGRWSKTYKPAINMDGVGMLAEHNEMFNGPHAALFWSGNYNTMQYNLVHDVCQETADVGAFYSGRDWTRRGNVVKYNLFYNITGYGSLGATGVYFDDQYSSGEIFGNIFYNVYRGVLIGGGRDNTVYNNVFINCNTGIYIDARGLGICAKSANSTLMPALASVPYTSEPWLSAFPKLATILQDNPNIPAGNSIGTNIFINTKTWKNFCTADIMTPLVTVDENCFNLTVSDFQNLKELNFAMSNTGLNKCSDTFVSNFQLIPVDEIGVKPESGPTASPTEPNSNNEPTGTVSTSSCHSIASYVFAASLGLLTL